MSLKSVSIPVLIVLAILGITSGLSADSGLLDSEKAKVSFFGFVKLDAVYQDGGVNGQSIPRYATVGPANTHLTAQHSRFGFKFSGAPLKSNWKIGAMMEWDLLDTASPNQMKFRSRQAFFSLQKKEITFLAGQAWDVFSPLGPTTLMTNGYLWQTGNMGFRHAQLRCTYAAATVDFALSINDPASAAGMKSKLPVLQFRLGLKLAEKGKIQVGLSGIYGREKQENAAPVYENSVPILGLGLDWNVPFTNNFALKGEFSLGENLSYAVSRSGVFSDIAAQKFVGKRVAAFWSELLYSKSSLNAWLGYAFENLIRDTQLSVGELQDTSCLLAGSQYALGSGVSAGVEFSHFRSQHLTAPTINTNQIMFSAIYTF